MSERFFQIEDFFISVRHIVWIAPNPDVPGQIRVVLSNGEMLTTIGDIMEFKKAIDQL
jgi:hypothetical protein